MEALIFLYRTKDIEPRIMTKLMDRLYGKMQKSNYGKYEYEVKGILPEEGYIRPVRAVLIVKKRYNQQVVDLFNTYGLRYRVFKIKLEASDFQKKAFF